MIRCSTCGRPIDADPLALAEGPIDHTDCLAAVYGPAGPAKASQRLDRHRDAAGDPALRKSGVFRSHESTIVLFIAAADDVLFAYHAHARAARFEVELARGGFEALVLAQLARPDAIVIDARDRAIDVPWVLRRLRKGVFTRALPIVVVGRPEPAFDDLEPWPERKLRTTDTTDARDVVRVVEDALDDARRSKATA